MSTYSGNLIEGLIGAVERVERRQAEPFCCFCGAIRPIDLLIPIRGEYYCLPCANECFD